MVLDVALFAENAETIATHVTLYESAFYGSVLAFGAVGGFFRTVRDATYRNRWDFFGVVGCSSLLAFVVVAFLARHAGGSFGREFFYLGIAAAVGLLGKESDIILRWVLFRLHGLLEVPERRDDDDGQND